MAEDKTTVELAPTFSLKPEFMDQLHPYARERLLRFLSEVYDGFGQERLTYEDLKLYLSEEEQGELDTCGKEIAGWLAKCTKDSGEASLSVYPYSMSPYDSMSGFKSLFKTAYERKLEKARQEAEEKKRLAAQKEKEERAWLAKIEEEDRKKQADKEYQEFLHQTNQTIKTFKKQLAKSKKPDFNYPAWLAGYHPETWCELELPTEKKIEDWAKPQIQERVPSALRGFVGWDLQWQVQTLPEAKYEILGIPCLTWCFLVLVLVKVDLRVVEQTFSKEFHGYEHKMKVGAENLGSFYLGPALGGEREGFSTPIALLFLLAQGEMEGPGIQVTTRGSPFTTFAVQGFEEETVVVRDAFCNFIRDITKEQPLGQALLGKRVIDEDVAKLVEEKAKLPLPDLVGAGASLGESAVDNSDVLGALQSMGFKTEESKKAIEAAHLSPSMSFEKKVEGVLKILGGNSL